MPVALPRTGPRPWTSALMGMWMSQCSGICTQILHQGKEASWWGEKWTLWIKRSPISGKEPEFPVCKYKRIPAGRATASAL